MEHDYEGKLALVAGGLGFIGANLVRLLHASGATIRVLTSRRSYDIRCRSGLLDALPHARCVIGDVSDPRLIARALEGCDVVFNLAGRSAAASSNAEPLADLDANQRPHLVLLEACRRLARPPAVVFASSRLVYGGGGSLPVSEGAALEPQLLYGIHTLAAERYHLLYRRLYGVRAVILRLTNTYGPLRLPYHRQGGVMDVFLTRAARGEPVTVYGEGAQLRDFLHVSDAVRAFLAAGCLAAGPIGVGPVFNVGSGVGVPLSLVAREIACLAGVGTEHVAWPEEAAMVEQGDFVADIRRAATVLGWRPRMSLRQGLVETLAWYRAPGEVG